MKAIILTLLIFYTLSACHKKNDMMPAVTKPTVPVTDTLSYLALGDSYTCGQSVSLNKSFPYQLATQLPGHAVTIPDVIAVTGWTTDQLIQAINYSSIKGKTYNIVTLLIGVNDQYQGLSKDNYRTKFIQVLNTAIQFAGGNKAHVFVLSIPDYGVTPFAQGREASIGPDIDQFNSINYKESISTGVNYIDITPASKQAATDRSLIAGDGLHPSGKMYKLWVDQLSPVVLQIFTKK